MQPTGGREPTAWEKTVDTLCTYAKETTDTLCLKLETDARGNKYLILEPKKEAPTGKGSYALNTITSYLLENAENAVTYSGRLDAALDKLSKAVALYNKSSVNQITLEGGNDFKACLFKRGQAIEQIFREHWFKIEYSIPEKTTTDEELVTSFYDIVNKTPNSWKLTEILFTLLFKNPKKALEILKDEKVKTKLRSFDEDTIEEVLDKMKGVGVLPDDDAHFAACIELLAGYRDIEWDGFSQVLTNSIQSDLPASFRALVKPVGYATSAESNLETALAWDSAHCLQELLVLYPNTSKKCLFERAIENRATRCLEYLTEHFVLDDNAKRDLLIKVADTDQAELVLVFCKNDKLAAAKALFYPNITSESFISILRFSKLDVVDELVQTYVQSLPVSKRQQFLKRYNENRTRCLKALPYVSRYTKPLHLTMIQGKYAKKEETKNVAIRDIEYGERCAKTVKELADKVKDNPNLAPTKFPFTLLPAGPDGSRNAAALLEEIATRRAMMQKMRAGDEKENPDNPPEYFERLRAAHSVITPVHKQYATGAPLIKSVVAFSKAKDLVRTTDGYALPYKEKGPLLNHVETREKAIPKVGFHAQAWNHGYAPIATTWPRIEEAFVELKKLRQLPATPERIVTFYQKAAEFAWLIGNTQPLIRGSGTANEWLFGVIHELFGYPLPVLKTAFPQFDVLDITFPLSDFIYNICYFFEPSTLPEPVQQKEIPGSILTQMRARYQQK